MRKAIIVPDLAYTSRKGNGKTGGHQQLKAKLKYLQYVRQEARLSKG
jgi:hypothetical protein